MIVVWITLGVLLAEGLAWGIFRVELLSHTLGAIWNWLTKEA